MMETTTVRRLARLGPICLLLLWSALAAAQELQPMSVQPNMLPAKSGKHRVLVTMGNRTPMGMDTIKLTVESNGGSAKFGELPTINPYQWQTLEGTVSDDDGQVLVVEYILNDKPQKLAVALTAGVPAGGGSGNLTAVPRGGIPSVLWLGGAALLGALVTLAGATAGRRGAAR